ncbi:hypothetical protein NPIL_419391 [Nephila pilipes]|uniref:Uncharacterized protein n=1 Tax=Nephila pilipes TaxID=299642 RepID=A0A8X6QP53_NEPPI|nr:hypothetical protein NPIL_419391 [Nephila pilipes]
MFRVPPEGNESFLESLKELQALFRAKPVLPSELYRILIFSTSPDKPLKDALNINTKKEFENIKRKHDSSPSAMEIMSPLSQSNLPSRYLALLTFLRTPVDRSDRSENSTKINPINDCSFIARAIFHLTMVANYYQLR